MTDYDILINGNLPRKGVLLMESVISLVIAPLLVGLIITLVDHWLDDQTIASKLLSNSHACIRNKCKEKPDLLAIGWAFVLFIRTYLVSHIHYSMSSKSNQKIQQSSLAISSSHPSKKFASVDLKELPLSLSSSLCACGMLSTLMVDR